ITQQEANWQAPEPKGAIATDIAGNKGAEASGTSTKASAKPFSLAEIEKGLQGGITNRRMTTLVKKYGVGFTVTSSVKSRLKSLGADDELLAAMSGAKQAANPDKSQNSLIKPF